ncbi:MAG: RNA polymerase-binding protein DksA [Candidatus Schekmanbacteria bacterium RBG_13_48_7]|uniref:RNA polymerase-binding protein DksA n=1 Tax=Candidatus Schekmanbacteria bacterium RBG_13_48_7 TaxID=1817878 RepID=A0A1F7RR58_9BACT|nr:MAG: RNA polymerase-binding protein DksA [Candidatus Schekmanbacteria bacterium RBG_13_48_7]
MKKEKLDYFKQKLLEWKSSLIKEAAKTLDLERSNQWIDSGDFGDQASAETDHNIMLRIREREKKLIAKIDRALERIEDETFGVCEECGGKIGEKRLEARLVATLCIDCKVAQEKKER